MRLLHLTMEAFGPFIDRTEIDFAGLGQNDLYLITGETGAGKTTIFDAMMFALYGVASGEERNASMFRSKYADETKETFVTLSFMYHGRTYTVTRKPGDYQIRKRRGEGTKKAELYAELVFEDGRKAITGAEKVTAEINTILGVNQRQFKQIAMIAQGEFRKLLTVKTEERKLMLRNIFGTENYDLVVQKLKEMKTSAEENYYQIRDAIKQERNHVQVIEESPYADFIHTSQANEEVENIEGFIETVETYIQEEAKQKAELEAQEEQITETLTALEQRTQLALRILEIKRKIAENTVILERYKEDLHTKEENLKNAMQSSEKIPVLNQKIGKLENELPQYENLTSLLVQKKESEKKKIQCEKQIQQLQAEEKHLRTRQEEAHLFMQENAGCEEILSKYQREEEQRKLLETNCREYIALLEKYQKQERERENLQLEYMNHKARYLDQKNQYDTFEQAYYDAQASILARKLKPGQPCPVCGSVHHDEAFVKHTIAQVDQEISKENLDREGKKTETYHQQMIASSAKTAEKSGLLKQLLEEIRRHNPDVKEEEINQEWLHAKHALQEVCDQQSDLQKTIQQAEKIAQNYRRAVADLPKLQNDYNAKKSELENKQRESDQNQSNIENLQKQITETRSHLSYPDEAALKDAISEIRREAAALNRQETEARAARDAVQTSITVVSSNLNQWQEEIQDQTAEDINQLNEEKTALLVQKKRCSTQKDALTSRISLNQKAVDDLREHAAAYRRANAKLLPIRELYRTYNGEAKDRVKLETYILSEHFDRILHQANRRMYEMSDGQYELLRKEDVDDKRRKEGLEIEIWDYNTNSARNVATLSGGESFMASLALALGLSDEVQQSSGGISFNSMFIDEGFGSLDEYALSKAINVLSRLSSHDCLIGIISHVTELKERIEKQIVVKKDPKHGSIITQND